MKTTMMYKKMLLTLAVAGAATAALADEGSNMKANQPAGAMPPKNQGAMETPMLKNLTDQQFVNDAAVGGMKEIRLSKLALKKSQDAQVKAFADRMITDHSKADSQLRQIAAQENLSYPATNLFTRTDPNWRNPLIENPPTLKGEGAYLLTTNAPHLADYEDFQHLESLSGHEFNLAYARVMVMDHINTVNEFEAASQNLPDPRLRKFATDTLPTLRQHSQMAQKLENQLAAQTASNSRPVEPVTASAGGR